MHVVRLHDPSRRPVSWTDIIRDGQVAAFAKDEATGVPCDAQGAPLACPADASCAIFDSFDEARAFCDDAVSRNPSLHFDVFDAGGRTRPPLLTVLHPSRSGRLETSPRQMRNRQAAAGGLIAVGLALLVYAYVEYDDHDIILPTFFGINMVLIALRLLWMNLALRETERARVTRVAQAHAGPPRR